MSTRIPAAYVCPRCEYVEMYTVPADIDFAVRHCDVPMKPITRAQLRKLDAQDPSDNLPRSFRR